MQRPTFLLLAILATIEHPCTAAAQVDIRIFDGQTLAGWTTLDGQPVSKGWEVVGGVIHLDTSAGRGGHIVTAREYGDFDLRFEWKIAARGNSGIKYRVRKFGSRVLGCEYQILDETDRNKSTPKGLSGALYDVYEPSSLDLLKPAGVYNRGRIIVCGTHIEHWLNGHLIVSAEVGDREWNERIAASKFAKAEGFGQNHFGKIMLTDHGSEVWYRNVKLYSWEPQAAEPPSPAIVCRPTCRSESTLQRLFNLFGRSRSRCR